MPVSVSFFFDNVPNSGRTGIKADENDICIVVLCYFLNDTRFFSTYFAGVCGGSTSCGEWFKIFESIKCTRAENAALGLHCTAPGEQNTRQGFQEKLKLKVR